MRREFMKRTGAAGLLAMVPEAVRHGAWAGGSDAPEKQDVAVGFIPLTDCAPVAMAVRLGLDRKYGLRIRAAKQASWSAVRDKLASGELDAAHALYGLVYGVQLGIGCVPRDMAVLMTLSANGQGISVSRRLAQAGAADGPSLARRVRAGGERLVFAQTFPTGTHAMWLNYWLAANGIDPLREVRTVVVPPPQMVAAVRAGRIDAFCVGEPWNHYGIADGTTVHVASSQDVWPGHPEKVLGATRELVERHPNTARALVAALLEACRWIDESDANRTLMAETIATEAWVNVPVEVILDRILGRYQDGLGRTWADAQPMRFHAGGEVNFPWLSDGMWFLTQFRRWGLLREDPDYLAVARQVNRLDLYGQAAAQAKVALPQAPMRASRLMDGATWDGSDPARYAAAHRIHA
jgi:nitrate/nitrite transport system substrate-binding protein